MTRFEPRLAKSLTNNFNSFWIWPWGFYGVWKWINTKMVDFVNSFIFENFMTVCVACNTVVLALDRYGISTEEESVLT